MQLKNIEIQKHLQNMEVVEACIEQIRKDMNLDLQYLLQEEKLYETLFEEIKTFVEYGLKNSPTEFFNMLYRIDIAENRLKQALSRKMDYPIEKISQMIIEREVQKVLFRKLYK